MSVSDDHHTPHRHVMFNPVTPDASPPPPVVSSHMHTTPNIITTHHSQEAPGDVSNVTSVDIQEMDQVRQHLQNMMKSMRGFNLNNDEQGQSADGHDGGDGALDNSMSSVDTAAFLQKLLPNSSPLEELKVHFGNHSQGLEASVHSQQSALDESSKPKPYHQHSSVGPDHSVMAENSLLREHLERERFRRKHCEQQIQELHGKLLEVQQELAVTVSSERKKDVMIEQLDKTLAKVVGGWKRHENEKVVVINTLKQEREVQEKAHQKQQEMLLQFEKELSQAVEALTKEQERASQAEREKESFIEKQKVERQQLLQVLSKEKDKLKQAEEENMHIIQEKEQAQHKFMEAQNTVQELSKQNRTIQHQVTNLEEEFANTLLEEKKNLEQERKISQDSHALISSLQKEVQRLGMDLDTTTREKESLKMEMSLMEARFEAGRAKEETERQAELEAQMNQRLEEIHQHMAKSDTEIRDSHRKQMHEVNKKHKEELQKQLEKFHQELKKKETKLKTASQEYEDRLHQAQDTIATLTNARQHLENERENITIRMQNMMQTHCEEALRLLSKNVGKSPAGSIVSQGGLDFSKPSNMSSMVTDKWQSSASSQQPTSLYTTQHQNTSSNNYSTTTQNYATSHQSSLPTNQYHEPKSFTYDHTTITAPVTTGYPGGLGYPKYPGSYTGSYVGSAIDGSVRSDVVIPNKRSAVDFVPLKTIHDDHDADSVISGLRHSPVPTNLVSGIRSSPVPTSDHPSFGYHSAKVLYSGGSFGDTQHTLLEQDLEDTRVTMQPDTPEVLPQRHHDPHIAEKLHEQEQRQSELNHYVNMLLKRSPGPPVDDGDESLQSGLMSIPRSIAQVSAMHNDAISPIKFDATGYPSQPYDTTIGSDSVTKDHSQATRHSSAAPAFTKTTVPMTFTARDTRPVHNPAPVPQSHYTQHQSQPHTPPRRDRDPSHPGPDQLPSLTPHQITQLSKLMGLVGGQPDGQLPSAEQLFGMLKGMHQKTADESQVQSRATDTSLNRSGGSSRDTSASRVKRSLDSSFPPKGRQKPQGPSINGHPIPVHQPHQSTAPSKSEPSRSRQSSSGGGIPRSGPTTQEARQPSKPSGNRPAPQGPQGRADRKPGVNAKQTKSSGVWR